MAEPRRRIVVGIDGSDESRSALEWAVAEARLRDASVLAIHAYMIPPLLMAPEPVSAGPPTIPDADLVERLEKGARALVDEEVGRVEDDGVTVEGRVVSGAAADALLQAARDADMLVVGTRGRGGFSGLLLGSVSQQLPPHAPCPVVVVPRGKD
jgi:nucleotide-binding universal stress UspA family protein